MKTKNVLGILLLCTVVLGGCAEATVQKDSVIELKESALDAAQSAKVEKGDIQLVTYYDAQVGPRVEQLTFTKEDTFGEFFVQLGDTVREGEVLATPALENLESRIEAAEDALERLNVNYNYEKTTLENELTKAQLGLEKTLKHLETVELYTPEYTATCVEAGLFDEQRLKVELQLKQLKETYDLDLPYQREQLKKLKDEYEGNLIKAPFDGTVIGLAEVEYGTPVNTKNYYVAVADTGVKYARCLCVSSTILKSLEQIFFWKDGKEYEVVSIPMKYDYYVATLNHGEDAYSEFEIVDPNGELADGDYGQIKLVHKEKKDVLLIPEMALQLSGDKYYVYKDVDGKHERVAVEVGYKNGLKAEITAGLEEGDVVYVQE